MPKGIPNTERVVWSEGERMRIAAACLPLLHLGLNPIETILKAQRKVLIKSRQKDRNKIAKILHNDKTRNQVDGLLNTISKAQAMDPAELAALTGIEPPAPKAEKAAKAPKAPKVPKAPGERAAPVRWTKLELARLAARVEELQAQKPGQPLSRAYYEAQEMLPPDRQRPLHALYVAGQHLRDNYAQGIADRWLIPAELLNAPPAAAPAPAQAEAQETPAAAAPSVLAPLPPPLPFGTLAGPLQDFAGALTSALGALLQAQAVQTLASLDGKLSAIAQGIGASIAAQIENGLRQTVLDTMAAELGGPVNPPPAPPNEAQAERLAEALSDKPGDASAADAEASKRIRVDVVGLATGDQEAKVRAAFNGHTELAFYHPDQRNGYTPHKGRHCIMITQKIPHRLKEKIRAAKVEPVYVRPGPFYVIQAIEELHRAAGIPQ